MNPARVRREAVRTLTDLPNVGPSVAADLRVLGIEQPQQLVGHDAWDMYTELCVLTQQQHDPCVIDVFLSLTDFIHGGEPRPWWHYTAQRKAHLGVKALDSPRTAPAGRMVNPAVPSTRTARRLRG